MAANALLVVSLAALAVALVLGARTVLESGVSGRGKLGVRVRVAFGVYAVTFAGFLATQAA